MNNFKYYRSKKKMSQKQVGEYLGISSQAYGNYENGRRQADYDTLLRLGQLFGTTIENLLAAQPPQGDITFDEFTYALHNESQALTEENRQKLLEMARLFKLGQEQGGK